MSTRTTRVHFLSSIQYHPHLRDTLAIEGERPLYKTTSLRDYYRDSKTIAQYISDGPLKSFAFKRLRILESKYGLYILLNEFREMSMQKRVPHRDFYNVRKVDTHVHHSSCMNQKHLLRFIKSKLKQKPHVCCRRVKFDTETKTYRTW